MRPYHWSFEILSTLLVVLIGVLYVPVMVGLVVVVVFLA